MKRNPMLALVTNPGIHGRGRVCRLEDVMGRRKSMRKNVKPWTYVKRKRKALLLAGVGTALKSAVSAGAGFAIKAGAKAAGMAANAGYHLSWWLGPAGTSVSKTYSSEAEAMAHVERLRESGVPLYTLKGPGGEVLAGTVVGPPKTGRFARYPNPGRPPKKWMERCMAGVGRGYDPGRVCGSQWYHKMTQAQRRAAMREYENNPADHGGFKLRKGQTVQPLEAVKGYYSGYGGRPEFNFEPGMFGRVINPDVPTVRGPRKSFVLVEFHSPITGQAERAAIYPENVRVVRPFHLRSKGNPLSEAQVIEAVEVEREAIELGPVRAARGVVRENPVNLSTVFPMALEEVMSPLVGVAGTELGAWKAIPHREMIVLAQIAGIDRLYPSAGKFRDLLRGHGSPLGESSFDRARRALTGFTASDIGDLMNYVRRDLHELYRSNPGSDPVAGAHGEVGKAVLLKGWGYWDTTRYDYGKNFHRAAEDTEVYLTGNTDNQKGVEFRTAPMIGSPITGWTQPGAIKRTNPLSEAQAIKAVDAERGAKEKELHRRYMAALEADDEAGMKAVDRERGALTGVSLKRRYTTIRIKPGEFGEAVMPYSEVNMHMQIAGRWMRFQLLKGRYSMVQLYRDDGSHFSAPITTGEAGVMEDEKGYYYHPYATPLRNPGSDPVAGAHMARGSGEPAIVDLVMAYESGDMGASETLRLFSRIVKSGLVWKLQGHYGRMASRLIETGYLSPDGDILKEPNPGAEWHRQQLQEQKSLRDRDQSEADIARRTGAWQRADELERAAQLHDYAGSREFDALMESQRQSAEKKFGVRLEDVPVEGMTANPAMLSNLVAVQLHRGDQFPTLLTDETIQILRSGRVGKLFPSDYKRMLAAEWVNLGRGRGYSSGYLFKRKADEERLEEIFNSRLGAWVLYRPHEVRHLFGGSHFDKGEDVGAHRTNPGMTANPGEWLNLPSAYAHAGRTAGMARRQGDEARAQFEQDWFDRAVALEVPTNKAEARRLFREAYRSAGVTRNPSAKWHTAQAELEQRAVSEAQTREAAHYRTGRLHAHQDSAQEALARKWKGCTRNPDAQVQLLHSFWGHKPGTRGYIDRHGKLRLKGSPPATITPRDYGRLFVEVGGKRKPFMSGETIYQRKAFGLPPAFPTGLKGNPGITISAEDRAKALKVRGVKPAMLEDPKFWKGLAKYIEFHNAWPVSLSKQQINIGRKDDHDFFVKMGKGPDVSYEPDGSQKHSNKAGSAWLHEFNEGGSKKDKDKLPDVLCSSDGKAIVHVGGKFEVKDWVRR